MRTLLLAAVLSLALCPCWAQSERPVILVYAAGDQVFAEMLANAIRNDSRIDSDVEVVGNPAFIMMATVLPTTECIVMYCNHRSQLAALGPGLRTFIEEGGGLVGMTEACYEPSAKEIATDVFPIYGNASVQRTSPVERRARTYVRDADLEISEGLPESFELISMGTYFPADEEGNYVEVPGEHQVAYRDQEIGSPLVTTYETEKGGRSVSLPGIWVVSNARVDVYYGKLLADDNFVRLLTNSVYWTAKGSRRFSEVSEDLPNRIREAGTLQDRLKEEGEKAARKARTRRLAILVIGWIIGLSACVVVAKKVVLRPPDGPE
jgi:hypothetical protein